MRFVNQKTRVGLLGSTLLGDRFLNAETRRVLFTSQTTSDGSETGVALGGQIDKDSLGNVYYHHGGQSIGGELFSWSLRNPWSSLRFCQTSALLDSEKARLSSWPEFFLSEQLIQRKERPCLIQHLRPGEQGEEYDGLPEGSAPLSCFFGDSLW